MFSSRLGDGITIRRPYPVKILEDVIAVSIGTNHVMAIRTDNSLWAWGTNVFGQLGVDVGIESDTPVKVMKMLFMFR